MNGADHRDITREKTPVGRIVAWVVASLLLVASAYCLVQSVLLAKTVNRAMEAEPLRMDVDLSKPGRYEGSYHQTYRRAHAGSLIVHLGPAPAGAAADTQPAGNFDGHVELFDAGGKCVFQDDLPTDALKMLLTEDLAGEPTYQVFRIPPALPIGSYKFVLDVRRPAPALARRKQTVIARYAVCELEMMPAFLAGAASVVFGLTGGIVALVLLVGKARRRRAQKLTK
jgi:hypothetical protein